MIAKSIFLHYFLKKYYFSVLLILILSNQFCYSKNIIPDITFSEKKIDSVSYRTNSEFNLIKFNLHPIYSGHELEFTVLNKFDSTDYLALRLTGEINNKIVEQVYIDSLKPNQNYKVVLKENSHILDLSSTINYTVYLIVKKHNVNIEKTLKYEVDVKRVLISGELITFLIIGFLFFSVMIFFLKDKNISKVLHHDWGNFRWARVVDYIARTLIIILLLDEIGFFLKEWGINIFIFKYFEFFLRIPLISYAVFIANFIIIIPATYKIFVNYFENLYSNSSDMIAVFYDSKNFNTYKKKYAFIISLFILVLSYIVWISQCFIWNEFKFNDVTPYTIAFWMAAILLILPVILMSIIPVRISKLSNDFKFVDSKINTRSNFIFLSIFFLSFSQTMITNILVLLPLINKLRNFSYSIINRIPPINKISEYDIIPNENSRNWEIFNFTLLTTSTITLLTFWQTAITPFPPLESFYPKAFTISLLYMTYILLYFLLVNTKSFYRIKSVFWILITLFILYGLPVFYPHLFVSADNYSEIRFYFINAFYETDLLVGGILLYFVIHIIAVYNLYGVYTLQNMKENLFSSDFNNNKLFKKYFFYICHKNSIISVFFIYAFFFTVFFFTKIGELMVLNPLHKDIAYFISALPLVFVFYDLIGQRAKRIYNEILKFSGPVTIDKLIKRNSFLKIYKCWNEGRTSLTGWLLSLFAIVIVYFVFFLTITTLLDSSIKTEFKLLWYNKDRFTENVIDIKETKDNLICTEEKGVRILSKIDGNTIFTFPTYNVPLISVIDDSLLWISDSKEISLLNIESGQLLYKKRLLQNKNKSWIEDNYNINCLYTENYAVIKEYNNLSIYDAVNNKTVLKVNNVNSPLSILRDGYPLWRNSKNEFCYYSNKLKIVPNLIFTKSILLLVSLKDNFIVIDNDSTHLFDYSGRKIWTIINYTSKNNLHVFDCIDKNSILFFAVNGDSLIALNKVNGKKIWQLENHYYAFLPYQYFNLGQNKDLILKNDNLILVTDSKSNYFEFVEVNSGNIVQKIPRKEFYGIQPITAILKDNTLYSISFLSFNEYSISSQKYELQDTYIINIKNKYSHFFKYDLFELTPLSLLVSSDRIYFSNEKGVFALERK